MSSATRRPSCMPCGRTETAAAFCRRMPRRATAPAADIGSAKTGTLAGRGLPAAVAPGFALAAGIHSSTRSFDEPVSCR